MEGFALGMAIGLLILFIRSERAIGELEDKVMRVERKLEIHEAKST
jgi:hypothetical protein